MHIDQVDENMQRAQRRGAVLSEKFWFRRDVGAPSSVAPHSNDSNDQYVEMTINEIVNGKVTFKHAAYVRCGHGQCSMKSSHATTTVNKMIC